MKKNTIIIIAGAAVLLVLLALMPLACSKKAPVTTFETTIVRKGTLSNTVTATGTLQALKTVDVGTQVSGVISKLYADFNSVVKKGQLLAELDRTPLLAMLSNSEASLDDSKAELAYQTAQFNRVKALYDKNMVAQTEYDQALYTYSKAMASTKIAQSNYDKAKINLAYATIYSPIDGVVLSRKVDEGQTVAANFSAPTLFSIANDLTQMQVEANIDEADIGQVKMGQKVEFTVDAFTGIQFNGEVTEIRLQPTTTSNVVTYTVIVKAPNPDKKLMPGMTANIVIIVAKAEDVLVAPLKALQFRPDSSMFAQMEQPGPGMPKPQMGIPGPPLASNGNMPAPPKNMPDMIWVKTAKGIHPVPVTTGVSDFVNVEIKSGLKEGDEVITSASVSSSAIPKPGSTTSSPFMPKPPKR